MIKRDPVYNEWIKLFKEVGDDLKILDEVNRHASPHCPEDTRKAHQEKYPNHWKLFKLEGKIGSKWHVYLIFSEKEIKIVPYTHDEIIWVGKPPFDEYTTFNASKDYPQLHWTPYPNPFNKKPILADINEFVTPGYAHEIFLPILIRTGRLNNSDAKKVKKLIWDIVKANLQKGASKKPYDEYPECEFLYKLRQEDTFQKYLKWYDLHMGEDFNTPKGFNFRQIAFLEYAEQEKPDQIKKVMKEISKKKNIGSPIKGEDAVEKGIKIIYQAIQRKRYPSKSPAKLFNCPEHGKFCPQDCKNLQTSMRIFNNRFKLKELYTTEGIDLIEDPKGITRPAKRK